MRTILVPSDKNSIQKERKMETWMEMSIPWNRSQNYRPIWILLVTHCMDTQCTTRILLCLRHSSPSVWTCLKEGMVGFPRVIALKAVALRDQLVASSDPFRTT